MAGAPIDRGWSWMVVLGVFTLMFFIVGGFKSMGILFVEIQETYGSTSTTTSLIIGLIAGGMSVLAPFASVLGEITTNRRVIIAGAILASLGAFSIFFAPSLLFIIIAYGLLTGSGYGLMFSPSLVVLGRYFDKRRSTANGFAMAGSSFGQLVIPPILRLLVDTYGFRGAMLIFSGLCLNLVAGAALLRPLTFYKPLNRKTQEDIRNIDIESSIACRKTEGEMTIDGGFEETKNALNEEEKSLCSKAESPVKKTHHARMARSMGSLHGSLRELRNVTNINSSRESLRRRAHEISSYDLDRNDTAHFASTGSLSFLPMQEIPKSLSNACVPKQQQYKQDSKELNKPEKASVCEVLGVSFCCCLFKKGSTKAKSIFAWSLFGNALYLSYLLAICTGNVGYINMFAIIPPHAEDLGIDRTKAALLLSIGGVCDIVGRLLGGWFADLGIIKRNNLMAVTITLAGAFAALVPLVPTFGMLVANMVMLGFFGGFYVSLFPVVLVDYVGLERMPTGFSMTIMCMGVTNIFTPTLLGRLRDSTGSWNVSFVICGMLMVFCALCFASAPLMRKIEMWKKQRHNRQQQGNLDQLDNGTAVG